MITQSKLEVQMTELLEPALDKLGASVVRADLHAGSGVVDVVVALPKWADRATRHDVIIALSDFEQDQDDSLSTNPIFVWNDGSVE